MVIEIDRFVHLTCVCRFCGVQATEHTMVRVTFESAGARSEETQILEVVDW